MIRGAVLRGYKGISVRSSSFYKARDSRDSVFTTNVTNATAERKRPRQGCSARVYSVSLRPVIESDSTSMILHALHPPSKSRHKPRRLETGTQKARARSASGLSKSV